MIAGYEPHRVAHLRWQTTLSLDRLGRLTSSDPAADGAIAAIHELRRALDIDLMCALNELTGRDPLAAGDAPHLRLALIDASTRSDRGGAAAARRAYWEDRYDRWQRFEHHSLFELEMFLRIEFTRQVEAGNENDNAAAFWSDPGAALITELERRTRGDESVDAWLVEQAALNPLIGEIVAHGDFDDATVVAVTSAILAASPLGVVRDTYRADAITALLEAITARPAAALDLLSDADATHALFRWNTDAFHATHIPDDLLGDLIVNGLVIAPAHDATLSEATYRAIGTFVSLASDPSFELGFTAPVAQGLSVTIATHAPIFLDSSSSYCRFDAHDNAVTVPLGDRSDLVDFFAALMHDSTARAVLTAALHDLASGAVPSGPKITPEQVSAFSVLLDESLDHANLDLDERTAAVVSFIGFATTISNFVAGQLLSRSGVGALAKFLVSLGIKRLGSTAQDRVRSDAIEAPDFAVLGDLLIEIELLRTALGAGAAVRPTASQADLGAARDALEAVDRLIIDGPSTFAEVERAMSALRRAARVVVEPPPFTRFVPRTLDADSNPCDPGNEVPRYGQER